MTKTLKSLCHYFMMFFSGKYRMEVKYQQFSDEVVQEAWDEIKKEALEKAFGDK